MLHALRLIRRSGRRIEAFVRYRVGWRGAAILLCAYIWFLFGIGAFFNLTRAYPHTFHTAAPNDVRAGAWMLSAAVAVWGCWVRMPRRPDGERYRNEEPSATALGVLWIMPALHMLSFLIAFFGYGVTTAFYGGAFYLAAGFIVILASKMPVPHGPVPPSPVVPPTGDARP